MNLGAKFQHNSGPAEQRAFCGSHIWDAAYGSPHNLPQLRLRAGRVWRVHKLQNKNIGSSEKLILLECGDKNTDHIFDTRDQTDINYQARAEIYLTDKD